MIAMIESFLVLILLISLIVPNLKIYRVGEFNQDYLSLKSTKSLRGLMAVLIVLHHLSGYYTQLSFLSPFQHIGYIIVAVFFFLSGYGLLYGLNNKEEYLDGFLQKRLSSIIIPYYLITLFYAFVFYVLKEKITIKGLLLSLIGINGIIPGNWYIVMQAIMYLLFFISFRTLVNKKFHSQIALFSVLFIIVFLLFLLFSNNDLYTRSLLAFPLGMLWCKYKNKVDEILQSKYIVCLVVITVLQILTFGIKFVGEYISNEHVAYLGSLLSSAVFPVFVILILCKIKIGNLVLDFLGGISLEMYLIHNLALISLHKISLIADHSLLFVVATFAITVSVSYLFNKLDKFFIDKFKKIFVK